MAAYHRPTGIDQTSHGTSFPLSQIVRGTIPTIQRAIPLLGLGIALNLLFTPDVSFELLAAYLIIALSALLGIIIVVRRNQGGLPIAAALILQNGITYGFPILKHNDEYSRIDLSLMLPCAGQLSLFIITLIVGWKAGLQLIHPTPSKLYLVTDNIQKQAKLAKLALGLLTFGLLFQISLYTGIYWRVTGSFGGRLFSLLQVFVLVASVAGGFLGAYFVRRVPQIKTAYWALWWGLFVILVSSVLLSSATGLVLSTFAGLMLGARKVPWVAMITILLTLAFLNQGKFVMREKYWGPNANERPSLIELPGFFAEWGSVSAKYLIPSESQVNKADQGQSLADRLNNFSNILFVNRALSINNMETLEGKGYAYLPWVFVPRVLWPDKPRTHEGQALLNVHFRRQMNYEATETTYVAWGLLPEAQGNLGLWFGPIVLGIFIGTFCGAAETWSSKKDLASVEGLGACILLITAVGSFEMSMGVLAAMLFQTAVALLVGGIIIRKFIR